MKKTKTLDKQKVRSRLVRKGVFAQLPLINKDVEAENILFRTIIDGVLFDMTSDNIADRKEGLRWINPEISSEAAAFNTVCSLAGLKPQKTREMMLRILDNYFPEVFESTSCYFRR